MVSLMLKKDFAEAFANLNKPARITLFSFPLFFYLSFLHRFVAGRGFFRVNINESKRGNRERTL